ncbi:hypothetical protein J3A72_000025 [Stenotrophomonas sp. PvP093]|uniref:SMODS domain-containing nucleotidyltransferase n=1 Tax=Stenotrophomonas TaxID=40323 RepID=UPI0009461338|nr:nucleotidyltransferase [Stenotrophomonas sp. PvP093]MCF3547572.1 nucleotidyltransferase [Stenotrophomonas maltophilia]MBP2479749.1 hypothetical protein [Stenotrophomonas sp. PvP093]TNY01439.1 nucleotidyltransferase [Stenotrophomonas maltophilia]TPD77765.1 nucleotidyltransferase [Stenotrophomonas maltophilia]TPD85663.1 nucleotidyltransferase [Stenotrophomonas maltophilia]
MKNLNHFNSFLANVVNLNSTRLDQLENSFAAIEVFLRNSNYVPRIVRLYKHGSWAHQTIIRPLDGRPFDADVILFVRPVEGWTAADYVDQLARTFESSPRYADKVRRYPYCVTLEYAGDRKMDIAPCVIDRLYPDSKEVCNRRDNAFQASMPEEYTSWLRDKNSISGNNSFRKVTRLAKYLRDYKGTFTCPSFLFTTLLGERIHEVDRYGNDFSDVPTSLRTLFRRLDDWLQENYYPPHVPNPVLPAEDQASEWSEEQYRNFRNAIHRYRQWIDAAFDEQDSDQSIELWRRIFGDSFALVRQPVIAMEAGLVDADAQLDDVEALRIGGLQMVPVEVLEPGHRQQPPWPLANFRLPASVSGYLVDAAGIRLRTVRSGEPMAPNQDIRFEAKLGGVQPNDTYRTMWRVTNTGEAARRVRNLRGGFDHSDQPHSRRETLSYRGVHQIEAFILNADGQIVGFSQPFYVAIE